MVAPIETNKVASRWSKYPLVLMQISQLLHFDPLDCGLEPTSSDEGRVYGRATLDLECQHQPPGA